MMRQLELVERLMSWANVITKLSGEDIKTLLPRVLRRLADEIERQEEEQQ